MEIVNLLSIITVIVTWISGFLAKKYKWWDKNLIPLQNVLIGVIMAIIEWIVTKDFNTALMVSGVLAGGTYDIFHNLGKILKGE